MPCLLGLPAGLLRASARLLLLALSVSTLGPVLHGVHTPGGEPAFVVHDERAHHVQAPGAGAVTPLAGEHCVACHFARSSRGAVSWEPSGLSAFDAGVLLFHEDGRLIASPSALPRPARAPPALSPLVG